MSPYSTCVVQNKSNTRSVYSTCEEREQVGQQINDAELGITLLSSEYYS